MELITYFFDTYAFHEVIAGNPNYKDYSKGIIIITTKLNLMELYYGLLLKFDKKIAEKYFDAFAEYAVDIDDATMKEAMVFRYLYKDRRLSYVDCVGYIIAKQRNIKFLTGDKEFENLPNVEFVK